MKSITVKVPTFSDVKRIPMPTISKPDVHLPKVTKKARFLNKITKLAQEQIAFVAILEENNAEQAIEFAVLAAEYMELVAEASAYVIAKQDRDFGHELLTLTNDLHDQYEAAVVARHGKTTGQLAQELMDALS